ncbi:MAG: phage holin family protein [Erysipelotrichaceae bacterium]|nr:phage holin family protein [Erysipelotrichaceae bacterium]
MRKSFGDLLIEFVLGAAVILIVSYMFPGVYVKNFMVAFLIAVILAVLNTFVKPILTIIALPFTILTLGLFQLIINGFVLSIAEVILAPDFYISSFGLTIIISLVISLLYSILGIGNLNE